MKRTTLIVLLLLGGALLAAWQRQEKREEKATDSPFAMDVEDFVENFKGAGEGVEGAGDRRPFSPEESIKHFQLVPGLEMEVVASEPVIRQPLNLHFDERGRLWVVQYLQYPFPAGLKILKYDRYLRAVFDKVPPAPPHHDRGADRITILEDTNGDGRFDSHKDFLTGLNIVTSVAVGRGGVWVLNPPYLLFYPDRDKDDVPDANPEVHLSGFGLEDTHSLANSLHWGPDGWLYGATGSTSTHRVKGIHFLGQAIWRYHPETREFELFAEGGGNTWSVEFDRKGRLFSGTNHGATRGLHYAQGGYYIKNFSKHGPLTNPFTFGYLAHMEHTGYQPRFAQTMIIYEGGALPGHEGQIIAGMSLTNRVQASELLPDDSTFKTIDTKALILTDNKWFRPVDTKIGPNGAVYIADWHDIRLSHLSPHDNWYRAAGRIYGLKAEGAEPISPFDLSQLSNEELIELLSHENKWFREQARRILGERGDRSILPQLKRMVEENGDQIGLEAFWAVNLLGGFDDGFALAQLGHPDPYVRYWTVRLLGDARNVSSQIGHKLVELARMEASAEVRSQLAGSCRRLPARQAFPILRELLLRSEDVEDPHLPLLLWWAIEDKAASDRPLLLELLEDTNLWRAPLFANHILPRLGRRFTAERGEPYYTFSGDFRAVYSEWKTKYDPEIVQKNFTTGTRLLELAPDRDAVDLLAQGMEAGLARQTLGKVPAGFKETLSTLPANEQKVPGLISLALRLGMTEKADEAAALLADSQTPESERKRLIAALADTESTAAVPIFLRLLESQESESIRSEVLKELRQFHHPQIPKSILALYPQMGSPLRGVAQDTLISRKEWARLLLESVDRGLISAEEIHEERLVSAKSYDDARIDELIRQYWEHPREETGLDIGAKVFIQEGEKSYQQVCAYCHLATGEGMRASLVGSRWVLGSDSILTRIVLDGKKGEEIEMPPLRAQLNDQQIAAILTYIRQEWGNRARAVDSETVAGIRSQTDDRNKPWTEEELLELVK